MRKKVAEMEARIAALEADQKLRSTALADPATYADDKLRARLLSEYQQDADKLEQLTGRWEIAVAELEQAEAELAAS
jgi:ATP-binding cassette subfamily F protein 3